MTSAATDRAVDLLAENATEGLGPRRLQELDDLLRSLPGEARDGEARDGEATLDKESFELAAAAIELAYTEVEPMPATLRQRVAEQAAGALGFLTESPSAPEEPSNVVQFPVPDDQSPSAGLSPWLGWVAAAAVLILAIVGWLPEAAFDPAEARERLLAQAEDVVRIDWKTTDDPAAAQASGDVVWSDARQEGYMRFRGLQVNEPGAWQYQLWIFDPAQDARYPIDGGVFDVGADGEVVVPIVPKLRVTHATLFAVTVEKAGGVVVSSRERLPLLAEVA